MSYFDFLTRIDKEEVKTIFELGSRDLKDAIELLRYFGGKLYAFECNPDCLNECEKNMDCLSNEEKQNLNLVKKAVCIENGITKFFPFDLEKYDNMGSSSLLKIDFTLRNENDPDFCRENPQKEIIVDGIRLDTYLEENNIARIDLLCIDLQGYELNALKSLGKHLENVKYIITECSITNTYIDGAIFSDLNNYLEKFNFRYICSNTFGSTFPYLKKNGFNEFDALFINYSAFSEE